MGEKDAKTGKLKRQPFNCGTCTEKKKKVRNCKNAAGYIDTISHGKEEHDGWPDSIKSEKMGPVKFYECPLTAITPTTSEIIKIVNSTSDENGNPNNLTYRGLIDLPPWLREAYEITQQQRAEFRRRVANSG